MRVSGITSRRSGVALIFAVLAAVALFAIPATASAGAAAGAEEEYIPNDPGCSEDMVLATAVSVAAKECPDDKDVKGDSDTGVPGTNGDGGSAGRLASTSGGDGDSLPFTGYPLTSLVLLAFALLVAGALLRAALALRERSRPSGLNTAA